MRAVLTLALVLGCSSSEGSIADNPAVPDDSASATDSAIGNESAAPDDSATVDDSAIVDDSTTDSAIAADSTVADTAVLDSKTAPTDTAVVDSKTATDTSTTDSAVSMPDTATPPVDSGPPPSGSLFEQPHPWTKDVSASPKSVESDKIINGLTAAGGWGGGTFRMDFSIEVLRSTATTPLRSFTATSDFYSPDCDKVSVPVPVGGALEGESGYACAGDGDCHLIVIDSSTNKLFEMWRANITSSGFFGGCLAVWDLKKKYGDTLRGKGCSSADAAGFPITAMLGNADEVAAGKIEHALRFILPNARIQNGMYVAPSTHSTGPTSGGADTPPYGVRFRLRASYPVDTLPNAGAKVVARALQKYGMFLADGGTIALTLQNDRFTTGKWSSSGITSNSLTSLKVNDFEVVEMGPRTNWKADTNCYRNP